MTSTIKKSPLCDLMTRHTNFDFDDFVATTAPEDYDHWNGYCLPVAYGDAAEEYDAIRKSCAIFDASPMKKYRFRGSDAGRFLDRILTAPVSAHLLAKAALHRGCKSVCDMPAEDAD